MARKPCAQSVPQLKITELNCGCKETRGRFSRIARNAILPFYYDCSKINDPLNNLDQCNKVFYIKNPKYFAGTAKNNPGSMVTQAMRYAHLARINTRHINGKPKTIILDNESSCSNILKPENWYNLSEIDFQIFLNQIGQEPNISPNCICNNPWNVQFSNNTTTLSNT